MATLPPLPPPPLPTPPPAPPAYVRLGSTTAATHLVEGQRIRHPSRGLGTIVHVSPGVREVRFVVAHLMDALRRRELRG